MAWHGFLLATATVLLLALFGFRLLGKFNIPFTAILASALYVRPILAVIKPRVLQMLAIVLGIIQFALGIRLLFTAVEVHVLAIKELLR
jgi:hypothetical protein